MLAFWQVSSVQVHFASAYRGAQSSQRQHIFFSSKEKTKAILKLDNQKMKEVLGMASASHGPSHVSQLCPWKGEQVTPHPHPSDFIFLTFLHSAYSSRVSGLRDEQTFYAETQMATWPHSPMLAGLTLVIPEVSCALFPMMLCCC